LKKSENLVQYINKNNLEVRKSKPFKNKKSDKMNKVIVKNGGETRERIAEDPKTPVKILRELAKDEYWVIRYEVTGNPKTPVEILKELAKDEDERVRRRVAEFLKELAEG